MLGQGLGSANLSPALVLPFDSLCRWIQPWDLSPLFEHGKKPQTNQPTNKTPTKKPNKLNQTKKPSSAEWGLNSSQSCEQFSGMMRVSATPTKVEPLAFILSVSSKFAVVEIYSEGEPKGGAFLMALVTVSPVTCLPRSALAWRCASERPSWSLPKCESLSLCDVTGGAWRKHPRAGLCGCHSLPYLLVASVTMQRK